MSSEIPKHGFNFSKFAEASDVIEAINAGNACISIQKIEYLQRCRDGKCHKDQPVIESSKK